MRHNISRTLAEIDTFDLTLEKRGRRTDITPERREATAAFAESEGYARVARRLREENARRYGYGVPSLEAVPDDRRRPLKSPAVRRPLLEIHEGGGESPKLSTEEAFWADVTLLARRHRAQDLSLPARLALDALRRLSHPGDA